MRIRFMGSTFFCALLAATAYAQVFTNSNFQISGDTATVKLSSPRPFAPAQVTGAPFTADRMSEHTQTLADGTHIRQPANTEHISRDSQGRTRTERRAFRGMMLGGAQNVADFQLIEIIDPVAGVAFMLDDQNKVAHRVALEARPQRQALGAPAAQPATGAVMIGQAVRAVGGAGAEGGVARTATAANDPRQPQHTMEKLEIKNIEGVFAEGTRSTTTWPVDSQGNDRPIVQTNEFWYSAELKETVLSTNSDPRNGESITKLINISRAEPDASLFQPPPGYTIVDEKDSFSMTLKRP